MEGMCRDIMPSGRYRQLGKQLIVFKHTILQTLIVII